MTGRTLGLRSLSYGSLQQMQNGSALPIQSPPGLVRKPAKIPLSGSRERERFLPRIRKVFYGRRKVGMLLLLLVSAVVLSFIYFVSKDGVPTESSEIHLDFANHVQSIVNLGGSSFSNLIPTLIPNKENNVSTVSNLNQQSASSDNIDQLRMPLLRTGKIFARHPCESFSLPPPSIDKKRTGPRPCPVCYVSVEQAVALMPPFPSVSPILKNLRYALEEKLIANESNGGSLFGGYPSLLQRNESFDIRESMTVHCGFVMGQRPGQETGFNIDESDLLEMEECHGVVVASAIFGNYDILQQPKNISDYTKNSACFYMFVDEETKAYIKNYTTLDSTGRAGLWRVVLVLNLPYEDARRNGKVPKLLLHRLFPNARFSLWIDGKLQLIVDPYQILERFLWRKNCTFAISRHYKRFDVFKEAEANKVAGKYDNASIDYQIEFYKKEGLTHYASAKLPITSDVPEGCVIIREHIPVTNLFTCLWFNEVDRFTSRDQLSFSTVRDRIMSKVNWTINMFMDCERRNFVVQAYHRDLLEQRNVLASLSSPTLKMTHESPRNVISYPVVYKQARAPPSMNLPWKVTMKHGRDGKSGSKPHQHGGDGKSGSKPHQHGGDGKSGSKPHQHGGDNNGM